MEDEEYFSTVYLDSPVPSSFNLSALKKAVAETEEYFHWMKERQYVRELLEQAGRD